MVFHSLKLKKKKSAKLSTGIVLGQIIVLDTILIAVTKNRLEPGEWEGFYFTSIST